MAQNNGAYSAEGLDGLLGKSSGANLYYASLPEYVREMLAQRGQNIQSEDELRRFAENILQGDK